MAIKRSVIVRGCPVINEDGVASEAIQPGHLVKGIGTIAKQTGTGDVPVAVALERDELGTGIDNTYQGEGTGSAYYASGDTVKVAEFAPGDECLVYLASGQTIAADGYLISNGAGLVTPGTTAGAVLGRAIDAVSAGVAAATLIRMRVQ